MNLEDLLGEKLEKNSLSQRGSHCGGHADLEPRSACLCFSSAGVKGLRHHCWAFHYFLKLKHFIYSKGKFDFEIALFCHIQPSPRIANHSQ